MTFSGKRYRITPSTAKKATEYPNARWTREKRPGCKRLQNGVGEDSAGAAGGDAYGTLPVPLECQRAESSAEIGWHHEESRFRPMYVGAKAFFCSPDRARILPGRSLQQQRRESMSKMKPRTLSGFMELLPAQQVTVRAHDGRSCASTYSALWLHAPGYPG